MRRARGFTLLEVAIAMAIVGVGIVEALQVFSGSLRLARQAGRKSEAVMHAKALMDSALWSPELVATVSHGEIGDGFRWERAIRRGDPTQDGLAESEFQSEVTLAVVAVSVRWSDGGDEKEYSVGTMRVVPDYGDQQQ